MYSSCAITDNKIYICGNQHNLPPQESYSPRGDQYSGISSEKETEKTNSVEIVDFSVWSVVNHYFDFKLITKKIDGTSRKFGGDIIRCMVHFGGKSEV